MVKNEQNIQKLYKLLSKILGISTRNINDKTSPDNTPSWDSFNGLMIASELEKQFKIKFTVSEIIDVKNVGDIKRHLMGHGIKFN